MRNTSPEHISKRKYTNLSVPINTKHQPKKILSHVSPIDIKIPSIEKKDTENYISRIINIYSSNPITKPINRDQRLHSKVAAYRNKTSITELSENMIVRTTDHGFKLDSNLKKGVEVSYDKQKFIIQANKFDHLSVRIAEKDWNAKAREEIIKAFPMYINTSNGITVLPSQNSTYTYFLGRGNNSELVKRVLCTRPWWSQVEEETLPNVNFAWTQILNSKFVLSIPLSEIANRSVSNIDPSFDKTHLESYNLGYGLITNSESYVSFIHKRVYSSNLIRIHNRLECNYHLSDKKYLYLNMKKYYSAINENVFDYLPLTFHIEKAEDDINFMEFIKVFENLKAKKNLNLWILKPGENCNRGNGICLCNSLDQIRNELKSNPFPKTGEHTFVIQKYIEKPFLYNKRKFDIRLYCLVTSINGYIQAYYYQDGYIRTASKEYNPKVLDNKFIHLTNDAIQKKSEDYGKYEYANKISYSEFQRYLDNHRPKVFTNFFNDVLPNIKKIVKDTILAVYRKIDLRKRAYSFEIYGYDFLLDENLKPWLIEVNTNPCLELSSGLLANIIPSMLENAFRIAVDPLFPQPGNSRKTTMFFNENHLENKFELIFHEINDGAKFTEQLEKRRTLKDFLY
jgi:Tubulin-tyrosine ligase family